jgi:calcium binding protein
MKRPNRDPVREDRIENEAIVDASPDEQAMSWYYYLEGKIRFPFSGQVHRPKRCLTAQEGRDC